MTRFYAEYDTWPSRYIVEDRLADLRTVPGNSATMPGDFSFKCTDDFAEPVTEGLANDVPEPPTFQQVFGEPAVMRQLFVSSGETCTQVDPLSTLPT